MRSMEFPRNATSRRWCHRRESAAECSFLHSARSKGFCSTFNAISWPDEKIIWLLLCKSYYGSSLLFSFAADTKRIFSFSKINKFSFSDSFPFCFVHFFDFWITTLPHTKPVRCTFYMLLNFCLYLSRKFRTYASLHMCSRSNLGTKK